MRSLLFLILLCLSACATTSNTSKVYTKVDTLVAKLGQPTLKDTLPNGNTKYIYVSKSYQSDSYQPESRIVTMVAGKQTIGVNAPTSPTNTSPMSYGCVTSYEVNPSGTIVNITSKGSDCR